MLGLAPHRLLEAFAEGQRRADMGDIRPLPASGDMDLSGAVAVGPAVRPVAIGDSGGAGLLDRVGLIGSLAVDGDAIG
jgi:hypothetical protein